MKKKSIIVALVMMFSVLSFSGCTKIIQKIKDPISPSGFTDIAKELGLEAETQSATDEMEVYVASDDNISLSYYIYNNIDDVESGYSYIENYLKGFFEESQYEIDEDNKFCAINDTQKVYLLRDRNVIIYLFSTSNDYNDRLDTAADKLGF